MAEAAPYFAEIARNDTGQAFWLLTDDGVRIRVGEFSKDSARGTVFLFPGRTEYIEKYGPAAADLAARGFATLAIDWRGQGLADRVHDNQLIGHVGHFVDYQQDARAAVDYARATGMPEPYYLLAHSMGGCIGLRALYERYPVKRAVFSAPKWGIHMSAALRPIAWGLSTVSRSLGFGGRFVPGQSGDAYVLNTSIEDNTLTSDPDMYAFMQDQAEKHPELGIGGPSLHWLNESLREMRELMSRPAPDVPCLTTLGSDEEIVSSEAIRTRMASWPKGELWEIPGARHEAMMEGPDLRAQLFDRFTAFFDQESATVA